MRLLIVFLDFWKVLARNQEPAFLTQNNLNSLVGSDKIKWQKKCQKDMEAVRNE